jgi:arylsulfatase A-like enzyme
LVWDAARFDYVEQHAPTINELRQENIWFERAIAPATWSLPSHASLFTGELPHEHGRYTVTDQYLGNLPLVDAFDENGYTTIGVSGNGFASPRTGFAQQFDCFHYTSDWGPFPEGLNVSQYALEARADNPDTSTKQLTIDAFGESLRHKRPLRSLVNFGAVTLNRLSARIPALEYLPHPLFNSYTQYGYSTKRTTNRITSFLADVENPFFLFANYMDTHRPYTPPDSYRDSEPSHDLSYGEIADLNELAAPWEFIRRVENGDDLTQAIQTIRSLYTGEVRSVDAQLQRIIRSLKCNDLYEDTIVIVTSDHGENLGEIDLIGNKRMGHESSVSKQLLEVPLLIAGPMFDSEQICERVSLRRVYDLLINLQTRAVDNEIIRDSFCDRDEVVTAEYPALGGTEIAEKYSDVSDESLAFRMSVDFVVGYFKDWVVVVDSTGRQLAWESGTTVRYEEVSQQLRNSVEESLEILANQGTEDSELSQKEYAQLEALGYL